MSTRSRKSQFSARTPHCEKAADEEQSGLRVDLVYTREIEDQLTFALTQQIAEEPFQVVALRADGHASNKV